LEDHEGAAAGKDLEFVLSEEYKRGCLFLGPCYARGCSELLCNWFGKKLMYNLYRFPLWIFELLRILVVEIGA
jgi:hypothetical protein